MASRAAPKRAMVHAMELIRGKDQHPLDMPALKQLLILMKRTSCALKPTRARGGLSGGQHLCNATAETTGIAFPSRE